MLLITQMSYLCHYWQHAYNLNILASIIQLDLHYWPSRAPFIRGWGKGTINYFMQGLASRLAFPALSDKPGHRECFGAVRNMVEARDREWWGCGAFRAGNEPRLFFLLKKRYPNSFVPRENEISIKTGDTGNFVLAQRLCCNSRAEARIWGDRFQAKMRKKRNSFQGFLLLSPQE